MAGQQGNVVVVEEVVDHPIYHAIWKENKQLLGKIIRDDPTALALSSYKWDGTPLIYAILAAERELKSGDELALYIIENGSKEYWECETPDSTRNFYYKGLTPFIAAAWAGQPRVAKKLVEKGVDPLHRWGPEHVHTALSVAVMKSRGGRVLRYLLTLPEIREQLNDEDFLYEREGCGDNSVLGLAMYDVYPSSIEKVKLLLEAGADPTFPSGEWAPLNIAREKRRDFEAKKDVRYVDVYREIEAMLQASIDESIRARCLFRARFLEDAKISVPAKQAFGETRVRPVDEFVQHRRERGEALPVVEIRTSESVWKELAVNIWKYDMYDYQVEVESAQHRMQVGDEGDVVKKALALPDDLFEDLMEMMVPPGDSAWRGEELEEFLDRLRVNEIYA